MTRSGYYKEMRALALSKRTEHNVQTSSLNLRTIRRLYKSEKIRIDPWDLKGSRVRAAYFCDNDDNSVMVNSNLPREPKLFALVHELKHHYVDRPSILKGLHTCGAYNENEMVEIGAEVFSAEFIYPEAEMRDLANRLGITSSSCTPTKVVEFKRSCLAIVSYKFIVKRFEWFGFCEEGHFKHEQFQKLEESLYGLPIYKQAWFQRYRARRKSSPSRFRP
ncbi:MAG: hypothetical protein Nkreftii_000059 [Candidatus Nitrospira kreftii]|uniref:IrrE N-terminal-like domain-containing protein n=1 Tax=Candidatus Nitrospira kreftii TaxID=2652173 RepID=A0A7S8FAF7_9BACT|nr:MAG: hypothetical protein Nkreftii_000059 [Candidatus Nitrospira kreftii]